MTREDQKEWDYRYGERMGNLCPDGNDNAAAREIAEREADEAITAIQMKERMDQVALTVRTSRAVRNASRQKNNSCNT